MNQCIHLWLWFLLKKAAEFCNFSIAHWWNSSDEFALLMHQTAHHPRTNSGFICWQAMSVIVFIFIEICLSSGISWFLERRVPSRHFSHIVFSSFWQWVNHAAVLVDGGDGTPKIWRSEDDLLFIVAFSRAVLFWLSALIQGLVLVACVWGMGFFATFRLKACFAVLSLHSFFVLAIANASKIAMLQHKQIKWSLSATPSCFQMRGCKENSQALLTNKSCVRFWKQLRRRGNRKCELFCWAKLWHFCQHFCNNFFWGGLQKAKFATCVFFN